MRRILYSLILFMPLAVFGQDSTKQGKVVVKADPRIDKILNRRVEFYNIDSTTQGYRLQILSITDRKEAMLEMENFQLRYPEIPIYLKYDSPNFKLRIGDFSDKIEAHYWFMKLQQDYPHLFVVPDKVNPKQIEE